MAFLDETTEQEVEKNKAIRGMRLRRRFLSDIDTTVLDGIFHQVDAFLGELHHRIFAVGIIGTDRPGGRKEG